MLELRRGARRMKLSPRLVLLMTLPPLLWAGNAVVGRLAVGHVAPQTLNAWRWMITLLLLLPLGWRALAVPEARAAVWQRRGHLALLGFFGVAAFNALQYLALTTTTALNATLIAASGPLWMMLVGWLGFHEAPQRRQWIGSALSLLGVLVVVGRGDWRALAEVRFVIGDLLMLLGVCLWALYSWLLARPPASMRPPQRPDWDWAQFLWLQVLFGIGWSLLAAGVEQVAMPQPIVWSPWVVALLLYVAVGPSVIAFRCWGIGVAEAGPTMAAFFSNLSPLFAAALSVLLVGEAPQLYHGVAFALVVAGIVISSRP
jgi:drug/metabolite transporter (DMT)-like permease